MLGDVSLGRERLLGERRGRTFASCRHRVRGAQVCDLADLLGWHDFMIHKGRRCFGMQNTVQQRRWKMLAARSVAWKPRRFVFGSWLTRTTVGAMPRLASKNPPKQRHTLYTLTSEPRPDRKHIKRPHPRVEHGTAQGEHRHGRGTCKRKRKHAPTGKDHEHAPEPKRGARTARAAELRSRGPGAREPRHPGVQVCIYYRLIILIVLCCIIFFLLVRALFPSLPFHVARSCYAAVAEGGALPLLPLLPAMARADFMSGRTSERLLQGTELLDKARRASMRSLRLRLSFRLNPEPSQTKFER